MYRGVLTRAVVGAKRSLYVLGQPAPGNDAEALPDVTLVTKEFDSNVTTEVVTSADKQDMVVVHEDPGESPDSEAESRSWPTQLLGEQGTIIEIKGFAAERYGCCLIVCCCCPIVCCLRCLICCCLQPDVVICCRPMPRPQELFCNLRLVYWFYLIGLGPFLERVQELQQDSVPKALARESRELWKQHSEYNTQVIENTCQELHDGAGKYQPVEIDLRMTASDGTPIDGMLKATDPADYFNQREGPQCCIDKLLANAGRCQPFTFVVKTDGGEPYLELAQGKEKGDVFLYLMYFPKKEGVETLPECDARSVQSCHLASSR